MAAPEEGVREPEMGFGMSTGTQGQSIGSDPRDQLAPLRGEAARIALRWTARKLYWSLCSGSKCVWSGRLEYGVEQMEGAEHVDSNVYLQWTGERGRHSSEEGVVHRRVGNPARASREGNHDRQRGVGDHPWSGRPPSDKLELHVGSRATALGVCNVTGQSQWMRTGKPKRRTCVSQEGT